MAKAMHSQTMNVIVQKTLFISMSCDEVTIVDNQNWLLVHLYVIDGWK